LRPGIKGQCGGHGAFRSNCAVGPMAGAVTIQDAQTASGPRPGSPLGGESWRTPGHPSTTIAIIC